MNYKLFPKLSFLLLFFGLTFVLGVSETAAQTTGQLEEKVVPIVKEIEGDANYDSAEKDVRIYFYKQVLIKFETGLDIPEAIDSAREATELFLQEVNLIKPVNLDVIADEARNRLI